MSGGIETYVDPTGVRWHYIVLPSGCLYWHSDMTVFVMNPDKSFRLGYHRLDVFHNADARIAWDTVEELIAHGRPEA
jgi:hypothetical protein